MAAEENNAEVLLSFLEYRAMFQEPIFEDWGRFGSIATGLFRAFREWNVALENVSGKNNPTVASEAQITVELLNKRIACNVGLGAVSILVTNPNWGEADLITRIARAGVEAVRASTKAIINKQVVTLAIHLKPQGRLVRDLTSSFVHVDPSFEMGNSIRGHGFSVYADDWSWVVDLSVMYSEALFVRLTRNFGPATPFEEMTSAVYRDENHVLELLKLRLD